MFWDCPFIHSFVWMTITRWLTNWFSIRPSLTLWIWSCLGFLGIFCRTYGRNYFKFGMLMYPDHLQNWFVLVTITNFGIILTEWNETNVVFAVLATTIWHDVASLKSRLCFWIKRGKVNVRGSGGLFPMLCAEFCLVRYGFINTPHSLCNITNLSVKHNYFFSADALSLERPVETALLLGLTGVKSVILNQWHCTLMENTEKLQITMNGKFIITHVPM